MFFMGFELEPVQVFWLRLAPTRLTESQFLLYYFLCIFPNSCGPVVNTFTILSELGGNTGVQWKWKKNCMCSRNSHMFKNWNQVTWKSVTCFARRLFCNHQIAIVKIVHSCHQPCMVIFKQCYTLNKALAAGSRVGHVYIYCFKFEKCLDMIWDKIFSLLWKFQCFMKVQSLP